MPQHHNQCAQAWLAEYGHRPSNPRERELYFAFSMGFEAGSRFGALDEQIRSVGRLSKVLDDYS